MREINEDRLRTINDMLEEEAEEFRIDHKSDWAKGTIRGMHWAFSWLLGEKDLPDTLREELDLKINYEMKGKEIKVGLGSDISVGDLKLKLVKMNEDHAVLRVGSIRNKEDKDDKDDKIKIEPCDQFDPEFPGMS